MLREQTATFRYARPTPPYWAARFDVELPPKAGQFMMAELGGPLREVLFPASIDATGFMTIVPPGHPATRLLPGTTQSMIGPLGHGFRVRNTNRLLLIAEAARLPVLRPLLESAPSVALVVEGTTRARLPAPPSIPPTVELILVTLDGSTGYLGPLESLEQAPEGLMRIGPDLLDLIAWAERICFACARDRYKAFATLVRQVRIQPADDFAQALVSFDMACGVGACEICRIPTRHGEKRVCTDGPVFDLLEIGVP